jgi:hypothetical protein
MEKYCEGKGLRAPIPYHKRDWLSLQELATAMRDHYTDNHITHRTAESDLYSDYMNGHIVAFGLGGKWDNTKKEWTGTDSSAHLYLIWEEYKIEPSGTVKDR